MVSRAKIVHTVNQLTVKLNYTGLYFSFKFLKNFLFLLLVKYHIPEKSTRNKINTNYFTPTHDSSIYKHTAVSEKSVRIIEDE